MKERYQIDLSRYSLGAFKDKLSIRELIPSRRLLKEKLDDRFRILEQAGITNLKELVSRLGTKPKLEAFSHETGLSIEYLTLLRREANSYRQKPVRLDKFSGIPEIFVERLEAEGIRDSRTLFHEASGKIQRKELANRTGIPLEVLDELICWSDLVRAYGVGPVFAQLLFGVGIVTIEELVAHTAEEIVGIYEDKEGKPADFGAAEIQFSLELARELDIAVEI